MLSNELQTQLTPLSRAERLIKRTTRMIESFKDEPGEKTQLALEAKKYSVYQQVPVVSNIQNCFHQSEIFHSEH
jgi:hypothetical protein